MFQLGVVGLNCVNCGNDETGVLIRGSNPAHAHAHTITCSTVYARADSPDMRHTTSPDSFFMRLISECEEVERERERTGNNGFREEKGREGTKMQRGEERVHTHSVSVINTNLSI